MNDELEKLEVVAGRKNNVGTEQHYCPAGCMVPYIPAGCITRHFLSGPPASHHCWLVMEQRVVAVAASPSAMGQEGQSVSKNIIEG